MYDLLSAQGLDRLHEASMRILSEFGIDFYDAEVRAILKDHGADVRGDTVFFDEALILNMSGWRRGGSPSWAQPGP